jgi:putative ABC transport system permease protein
MLANYLKIGIKVLLRRKFFTAISLFAVSFTLLVLMVVAALIDHAVAPMAPEVHQKRTIGLYSLQMKGDQNRMTGSPGYGFLDRYVRTLPDVERVSIFSELQPAVSYLRGEKVESKVKRTDGEFWQIMRFDFLEGRPLTADDDREGQSVAVINEATRRRFFGEGVQAVGRTIALDGQSFRIVGVVANVPAFRLVPYADVWIPIGATRSQDFRRHLIGEFQGIILAHDRRDIPRIKEEFTARLGQVEFPEPDRYNSMQGSLTTHAEELGRNVVGAQPAEVRFKTFVLVMLIGMLLFMLLPAINLVNINLSRILERSSEIGVRKAFGASSPTLVGQFVLENVLLCLVGGAIGLVLSWIVLAGIGKTGLLPYATFGINYRIFGCALLMAIIFGVLSGIYPAWKMSRMNPVEALKGASR